MTTRLLPHEEWSRLAPTALGPFWEDLQTSKTKVVVAEEAAQVIGCLALIPTLHVEGLWTHPDHRGMPVLRALWKEATAESRRQGVGSVMAGAIDDRMRQILKYAHATKVPAEFYFVPVKG
jgi:ribosomal protein S18 acetylase RimI-like enzyme